ncbi:uncharacterized protein LOC124278612 [Haliotis rubra]|uniref:uncharacterized protein LOC124278612 n=1 Tax=Haliotis rubra TaxID=36100 RepID=UPI001EE5C1D2|nr:uncharacterized protein LOC124278612 [Haliotis rubra]
MDGVLVLLVVIAPVLTSTDLDSCVTRREYAHLQQRVYAIENMQLNTGEAGGVSFAATLTTSVQLKENATIVFDNVLLNTAEAYNSSNGVFTALFYGIHFFSATIRADNNTALTTGIVKIRGL